MAAVLLLAACGRSANPATAVADAQDLIAHGKPGEARILLKNALAKAPSVPGARQLLARMAMDEGDLRAANDELQAVPAAEATQPDTVALKTRVALETGKLDEAEKLLQAGGDGIAEPQKTILRAQLLRAKGSGAEGLAMLRAAQQSHPDDESLALEIVEGLAAGGNSGAAIAEATLFLAVPSHPKADLLRMRGEVYLRQGKPPEGVKDLRAALAAAPPQWPRVQFITTELQLGEALLAANDIPGARAQVEHLSKAWPGMMGTEILAARLDLQDGKANDAASKLEKALASAPNNARLQYMLADALTRSGNFTRAAELLERRVAEEPVTSPARRMLATLLMRQGRPDRVVELLGQAGLEQSDNDDLLKSARLAQTQARTAIGTLTTRLQQDPSNRKLRAELAMAQIANGDPAQALVTLGPVPAGNWSPEVAAPRMAALLTMGNELEGNRLVDQLIDPSGKVDIPTLVTVADVAQRQGRSSMVSLLLERAAKLDPANADVQLRRANVAFEAKKFDEAEKLLRGLVGATPPNLTAGVALGRVLEAKGDVDGARKALDEAARTSPEALEPRLALGALEVRAGKIDAANKAFDALVAIRKDGSAANAAGMMLASSNHFDAARARFRQAIDQSANNELYWFNLGRAQLALGDRDAAQESFVKSAELQPAALPAVQGAVQLSVAKKDFATARHVTQGLLNAQPNSAVAWMLKGDVELEAGDMAAARSAYARSTQLQPSSQAAVKEFQVGFTAKVPKPEAPLVQWLGHQPGDIATRRVLGLYYMQTGDERAARTQMEAVLSRAPNDALTLNNLAWLLRNSDPAKAEELAQKAYVIAPQSAAVADTLGMVYLARGKFDVAVTTLAAAVAADPKNRAMQYHHGLALYRAGKTDAARDALKRSLADTAEFEGRAEARQLLEKLGS
jgi:putative PEP-CTERM system TPR-repeat lipoprotein